MFSPCVMTVLYVPVGLSFLLWLRCQCWDCGSMGLVVSVKKCSMC